MSTNSLPDLYKNDLLDCKIGLNPLVYNALFEEWQRTATEEEEHAAFIAGQAHWGTIASMNGGVLDLRFDRHTEKEDRTYCVAPFPVTSCPKHLRPAFTAAVEGHVLIDLDFKTSHWALLAWRSGDANLISDLRAGDIYARLPGTARDLAKIAFNTVLNGGGEGALTSAGLTATQAQEALTKIHALLGYGGDWEKAGSYLRNLKKEAVKQGWTKDEYAGGGIALMRLEAQALWRSLEHLIKRNADKDIRVVLPMHDGVLLSAPKEFADTVAKTAAEIMATAITRDKEEAKHSEKWVKAAVRTTWGETSATVPTLTGQELRAKGLRAIRKPCADAAALRAFGPSLLKELESVTKTTDKRSNEGKALKAAMNSVHAAIDWHCESKASALAKMGLAPIDIPDHERIAEHPILMRIFREDKAFPRLSANERTLQIHADGKEMAEDSGLTSRLLQLLKDRYGIITSRYNVIDRVVFDLAWENKFDHVKDWFNSLPPWDGIDRAHTWLLDYCNAKNHEMAMIYSRKWLVSIIARTFQPGCKVDTMLVLKGDQGAKKSSMLRAISPEGSFAEVDIDPSNKDSVLLAASHAINDWGEMSGLSRREQGSIKRYLTAQEDNVRPPYGRESRKFLRRGVFTATTNMDDFLVDETGGRRYWPVEVGEIDLEGIIRDKAQIWAEALAFYRMAILPIGTPEEEAALPPRVRNDRGCPWWLNPADAKLKEKEDPRFAKDLRHVEAVHKAHQTYPNGFTMRNVCFFITDKETEHKALEADVQRTLKTKGFETKSSNGRRLWKLKAGATLPPLEAPKAVNGGEGFAPATAYLN